MIILDLETTGLDPYQDVILEVAALRVDRALQVLGEFHILVPSLDGRYTTSPFVAQMHSKGGLWEELSRLEGLSIEAIELQLAEFVREDGPQAILAGDSIHFDRRFLLAYMPRVDALLHHRMVDTSSFMAAYQMWGYHTAPKPAEPAHRAMQDCRVSLEKLRFYKERFSYTEK